MADAPRRVVLATRNPGKIAELTRILAGVGGKGGGDVQIVGLESFPDAPDVAETGSTFADNALLKARAIAAWTGLPAVSDDSGLAVDALHGMPGVLSARWAGKHGDDQANLDLLIGQLADVAERGAVFVCVAALVVPVADGPPREWTTTGVLAGALTRVPRGSNGFGYDPIFVPYGLHTTTAELEPAAKDALSHRGRAFRAIAPLIAANVLRAQAGQRAARQRAGLATLLGTVKRHLKEDPMTGARLAPGDEAPDFTLPDADGNPVSLSSLRGQRVIVYFYPAALTPGCTKQACDFTAAMPDFGKLGLAVLGISPDAPAKLAKFREKEQITFPLLSDPDKKALTAYGAYGEKQNYGKTVMGVIRSTFVIDPAGKIEKALYAVKATGHVDRLRKELGV